MVNVIVDTNVLCKEGFNSSHMRVLERLCGDKVIDVFYVDIVRREFISKTIIETEADFKKAISALDNIQRRLSRSGQFIPQVGTCKQLLDSVAPDVETFIHAGFDEWAGRLGAKQIDFDPAHMPAVLDDYFRGGGAFSKPKNRDDIPDSMIMSAIMGFVEKNGEVLFVVGDDNFRGCMEGEKGVTVFESLRDCFCDPVLHDFASDSQLCLYFEGRRFAKYMQGYISDEVVEIKDFYLEGAEIEGWPVLGERVVHVEINGIECSSISDFSVDGSFSLSDELFVSNFSFMIEVGLCYVTDYADYLDIGRSGRIVELSSMNGDGMCELYEGFIVELFGIMEITLKERFSPEDMSKIVQNLSGHPDALTFDIDVHGARLISSSG